VFSTCAKDWSMGAGCANSSLLSVQRQDAWPWGFQGVWKLPRKAINQQGDCYSGDSASRPLREDFLHAKACFTPKVSHIVPIDQFTFAKQNPWIA